MKLAAGAAGAVVALALALSGCTETPSVSRSSGPVESPSRAPSPTATADLAAAKQAAGIADCPASDPEVASVPDGLPDAVLSCLGGGRPVRLAGLRGRPMMINVWAQWCGPCRQEAPFLSEIATVTTSDLMIVGIDHDDPRPDLAIDFAQVASWTYPQLSDPSRVLRTKLQVTGLPQTFFVRADGTVAFRHSGPFRSADEIRSLSRRHLGVSP